MYIDSVPGPQLVVRKKYCSLESGITHYVRVERRYNLFTCQQLHLDDMELESAERQVSMGILTDDVIWLHTHMKLHSDLHHVKLYQASTSLKVRAGGLGTKLYVTL